MSSRTCRKTEYGPRYGPREETEQKRKRRGGLRVEITETWREEWGPGRSARSARRLETGPPGTVSTRQGRSGGPVSRWGVFGFSAFSVRFCAPPLSANTILWTLRAAAVVPAGRGPSRDAAAVRVFPAAFPAAFPRGCRRPASFRGPILRSSAVVLFPHFPFLSCSSLFFSFPRLSRFRLYWYRYSIMIYRV